MVWSLLQRIHGVQKSQGPGVPKTDRWRLRSAPADKKGFKEGQATCCAPPWGLGRAASASTGSHSSRSPGSRRSGVGQRPGPKPAPDRRGPAPLRGLRKLRPLEVSRQPPNLLPGVRHRRPARTDTGKRQTRQPSVRRRRPGTGRAEGQDTRANAKSRAGAWRSRWAPSAGRGLREEAANRVKARLKADSVFLGSVGCHFRPGNK